MHTFHFVGDSIAAGRPSNWEDSRKPSFAGWLTLLNLSVPLGLFSSLQCKFI